VPTNKRQKELARRRAERQAARRAQERVRRRKRRLVATVTVIAVALGVGGIIAGAAALSGGDKKKDPSASGTPTPSASPDAFKSFPVACGGKRPAEAKPQSFGSKEPKMTVKATKKYTMTMKTSCGPMVFELDAKNAPHTVNSFAFLASKNFYDGSICHRMNDAPDFAFLQCGDPSGTGAGQAPGYTLAEENTKGAKYTRGTIAMANTGQPHSTGAQFFLLDKDATSLPPNYTVAGHITAGIENLDKIIALGTDKAFEPSPGGGHPKQAVYLEDVTVTES
jgi:peptidyl-prolyl cis-trans isomerase B (cyclophilin B)